MTIQRCASCGWYNYPPKIVCISCRADPPELEWAAVSGKGRVKTWTIMRDAFLPGFAQEVPYVVADIELVEQPGLRIVARLADVAEDELALGLPVEVGFDDVAGGISIPRFTPVQP